jgi:transcriptional regulator with XRE-family HTH domain
MARAKQNEDPRAASEIDRQIGARIRMQRLELGMSQDTLAGVIGVSFQQVQKYERGLNRIAAGTLVAIAKALDIDIVELLPGASTKALGKDVERLAKLQIAYSRLNENGRRLLLATAQTFVADPQLRKG